jgi:hypothetical protein
MVIEWLNIEDYRKRMVLNKKSINKKQHDDVDDDDDAKYLF